MEITPSDRKLYGQEVRQGLDIFEKSFKGLQGSSIDKQKDLYEQAMDESLQAIKDASKAIMNEQLNKLKDQLAADYQNYRDNPNDRNGKSLQKDIDNFKNTFKA